nr:uncharacterized protein LOC112926950 [Vulpes vulpes]
MRLSAARFRVCSGRPGGPCLQDKVELLQRLPAAAPGAGKFVPKPRGSGGTLGGSPALCGRGPGPGSGSGRPGAPAPQGCGASIAGGARTSRVQRRRHAGGERSCPRAAGAEPGPRPPGPSRRRPPRPALPRGPAAPPGPQQLDKGVWTGARGPVPCEPPGRPFKRDFGDSCSFRPNSSPLYPAETIF